MAKYDCVVLFNKSDELYKDGEWLSQFVVRDEVFAIDESLKTLGYSPYILEMDRVDKELVSLLFRISPKFIFNLCEGLNEKSEMEMYVAALLEVFGFHYTGSPPFALGLALNKDKVKKMLQAGGIPTPKYCVNNGEEPIDLSRVEFPVIVKPVHEDASLGISSESVVNSEEQLQRQISFICRTYTQPALVEQYIDGREVNVSILGDQDPTVLPISEIDFCNFPPNEPRIVSYQAKWNPESPQYQNTVPVCPAKLPPKVAARVRAIALQAFHQIGCRDYCRVDMRLDKKSNPYVLEVNPNPDISPTAGLARSAKAAGLSYTDLIAKIVECSLARNISENKLAYA